MLPNRPENELLLENKLGGNKVVRNGMFDYIWTKLDGKTSCTFTKREITEYLYKNHKEEESSFNPTLYKIFESDDRIQKLTHGKYSFKIKEDFNQLTANHIVGILNNTLNKLEEASTNITIIEDTNFTKTDRQTMYLFQTAINQIEKLKSEIEESK